MAFINMILDLPRCMNNAKKLCNGKKYNKKNVSVTHSDMIVLFLKPEANKSYLYFVVNNSGSDSFQ